MKAPIIVDERGDLNIIETVEIAESYLEAIDIYNNEYKIYDSEGRLLKGEIVALWGPVFLCETENEPSHQEELKFTMSRYLVTIGEDEQYVKQASLFNLVDFFLKKYPTK